MKRTFKQLMTVALLTPFLSLTTIIDSHAQTLKGVKNIILVHGAFADGSSWSKVIPFLQNKGLNVIAVQNPLTSFGEDVAATRRAIAQTDGPVPLVGHSYGGMVISEAGKDAKVAGLLYVAALPPTAVGPEFKLSPEGFFPCSKRHQ